MTSKQRSLIGVAAVLALAATQACGSSDEQALPGASAGAAPTGVAGAHSAGATASGGAPGSAGAPATVAGAPGTAGAPTGSGGSPGTAGAPTGAGGSPTGAGGTPGAGGAPSGAGGSHAGGSSGGASGGGTSTGATFAAVKTLIGMKCGTGTCHNKQSGHVDFQGTTDLHGLLTTALPSTALHCGGSTLAVAGNTANSLIVAITSTTTNSATCTSGGTGMVDKMPSGCTGTGASACLTTAQVQTFKDWITAGALAQ